MPSWIGLKTTPPAASLFIEPIALAMHVHKYIAANLFNEAQSLMSGDGVECLGLLTATCSQPLSQAWQTKFISGLKKSIRGCERLPKGLEDS